MSILLKAQLSAGFSCASVFGLVWYGSKPLLLGPAYQENAPTIENGVTFGEYRERKPGIQPECLGTYCTTLNPGCDPSLPLFATNPMYGAIQAAFSPAGSLPAPYETVQTSPPRKPLPMIAQPAPVIFLRKTDGVHYQGLKTAGIQFSKDQTGNFIYADLASISLEREKTLKTRVDALRSGGGTAFLSGLTPASERVLETLIGEKIEIFEREASSLVFEGEYASTDPLVDLFRLKELYFSEDNDHVIQRYGIRCQNLENTKVLLKACSCDWRM